VGESRRAVGIISVAMTRVRITIEDTPNPDAMKFSVGRPVSPGSPDRPHSFASAAQAADDPLASRLFALPGVTNVMYVADFCTVNKTPQTRWRTLRPQVKRVLQAWLTERG
jgi:hypothetical protein